jgi:hypothetical protein
MNHLECEPTRTAYSFSEWPDHTKILGNIQELRAGSSFPSFLMGIGQGDELKAKQPSPFELGCSLIVVSAVD